RLAIGIENDLAVVTANADNYDVQLRSDNRLTQFTIDKRGGRVNFELFEAEFEMIRGNGVEEIADRRLRQRHRHSVSANDRRRDDAIRARADQFALRRFFGSAGDNVKIRIQ